MIQMPSIATQCRDACICARCLREESEAAKYRPNKPPKKHLTTLLFELVRDFDGLNSAQIQEKMPPGTSIATVQNALSRMRGKGFITNEGPQRLTKWHVT